jgi:tol-pal system-associated acyl-CoA thioesterase
VSAVFRLPLRVYYQDTDAGGIVFHAQYLAFMERARTELLNGAGLDLAGMADQERLLFVVFRAAVRYHRAARLNEMLTVSAEIAKMNRASMLFRHRVEREGELLVEADITVALVSRDSMRPARMPQALALKFAEELERAPK